MDQIGKFIRSLRVFALSCAAMAVATAVADEIDFSKSSRPTKDIETSPGHDNGPGLFDKRGSKDKPGAALNGSLMIPTRTGSLDEKRSKELKDLIDRQQNWIFINPYQKDEDREDSGLFSDDAMLDDSSETESMGLVERFLFEEQRRKENKKESLSEEDDSSSSFGFGRDEDYFDPSTDIFSSLGDTENVSPVGAYLKENADGFGGGEDFEGRLTSQKSGWDLIFNRSSENDEENDPFKNGKKDEYAFDASLEQRYAQSLFTSTRFLESSDRENRQSSITALDRILNRGDATDRQAGLFGQSSPLNSAEDSTRRPFMPITANSSGSSDFQGIDFSSASDSLSASSPDVTGRSDSFDFLNTSPSFGQSTLPSRRELESENTTQVRSIFNTPTTLKIPRRDF